MPDLRNYDATAIANGDFEIAGISYKIQRCSALQEQSSAGSAYWNPNTGRSSTLSGAAEFRPITVTFHLSREHFLQLDGLARSPKAKDGTLTAVHRIGGIETVLTGVRISSISYGEVNRLSNDPAMVEVELSYEGRQVQGNTLPAGVV